MSCQAYGVGGVEEIFVLDNAINIIRFLLSEV
jgi:hypothetical protein